MVVTSQTHPMPLNMLCSINVFNELRAKHLYLKSSPSSGLQNIRLAENILIESHFVLP